MLEGAVPLSELAAVVVDKLVPILRPLRWPFFFCPECAAPQDIPMLDSEVSLGSQLKYHSSIGSDQPTILPDITLLTCLIALMPMK